MTTPTSRPGRPDGAGSFLHRVVSAVGRACFGVLLFCAAMTAIVATTFVGLILALAAVFLRASGAFRKSDPNPAGQRRSSQAETLEARPTAEGWVIETGGGAPRA